MSEVLYLPGFGKATECTALANREHNPDPVRFVWHHILPVNCGGESTPDNVVSLCDLCHYLIHELMYVLARDKGDESGWGEHGNEAHRYLARQGYREALNRGVAGYIPNEGGIL